MSRASWVLISLLGISAEEETEGRKLFFQVSLTSPVLGKVGMIPPIQHSGNKVTRSEVVSLKSAGLCVEK